MWVVTVEKAEKTSVPHRHAMPSMKTNIYWKDEGIGRGQLSLAGEEWGGH